MAEMNGIQRTCAVLVFALAAVLCLVGCAGEASRSASAPTSQQGVTDVLQERTQQSASSQPAPASRFVGDAASAYAQVDVDLTAMSSDMVYATVYDMMLNPSNYLGKIVKIGGPYYHTYYEATQRNYYYVVAQDATACCAQGLEFIWGDGNRSFPEEYPEDGSEVVVTGKFDVYTEKSLNYIQLADASLQAA